MVPDFLQYLSALSRGLALGVAIVIPFGPMKMLCLQRTFAFGLAAGGATAAGVVSGDIVFVLTSACGLTAAAAFLRDAMPYLQFAGAVLLFYLAVDVFRRPMLLKAITEPSARTSYLAMFASALGLTLSNPVTIVMFASVLLGAGGLKAVADPRFGGVVAMGIVCGSILVWVGFTLFAAMAGKALPLPALAWLNRIGGAILCYFAAASGWSGIELILES